MPNGDLPVWVGFHRPSVREQWLLKSTLQTFVRERPLWSGLAVIRLVLLSDGGRPCADRDDRQQSGWAMCRALAGRVLRPRFWPGT